MKNSGLKEDLATSIDVLNTLNGGVIEPQVKLTQFPEYRQIEVRAVSIPHRRIKAEVHNNLLTIYYTIEIKSGRKSIPFPKVVYNKQIPYFIDSKRISASFENGKLIVRMPYNEFVDGYHRDITASH